MRSLFLAVGEALFVFDNFATGDFALKRNVGVHIDIRISGNVYRVVIILIKLGNNKLDISHPYYRQNIAQKRNYSYALRNGFHILVVLDPI